MPKSFLSKSYMRCDNCGWKGHIKRAAPCPYCGSRAHLRSLMVAPEFPSAARETRPLRIGDGGVTSVPVFLRKAR